VVIVVLNVGELRSVIKESCLKLKSRMETITIREIQGSITKVIASVSLKVIVIIHHNMPTPKPFEIISVVCLEVIAVLNLGELRYFI
jgi:hypothetical protein